MACYTPLVGWRSQKRNPSGKRSITFTKSEGYIDQPMDIPCGKCVGCRLEYSRQWAIRCMHEADMHKENCFITLTYNNNTLPKPNGFPTLIKEDFQKFMKRLRKKYPHKNIKYYSCGEYGDKTGRPHYHACIFGLDFKDKEQWSISRDGHKLYTSKILEGLWPFGFSTIGEVNFDTAAYVARYVMKKRKGKDSSTYYEKYYDINTGEITSILPEFSLMSRRPGIGKTWLEKYHQDVYSYDYIVKGKQKMKPPKYYDSQYEIIDPDDMAKIKKQREKNLKNDSDNTLYRRYIKGVCKTLQIKSLQRSLE